MWRSSSPFPIFTHDWTQNYVGDINVENLVEILFIVCSKCSVSDDQRFSSSINLDHQLVNHYQSRSAEPLFDRTWTNDYIRISWWFFKLHVLQFCTVSCGHDTSTIYKRCVFLRNQNLTENECYILVKAVSTHSKYHWHIQKGVQVTVINILFFLSVRWPTSY